MPETRPAEAPDTKPAGNGNSRRLALIDKRYAGGLTTAEEAELAALQAKMDEHLEAIAPLPRRQLDALEEEVRKAYPDYGRAGGETAGGP